MVLTMWAKCSFLAFSQAVAKSNYLPRHACMSCPSVCPSVRVEQRNSHRTGFREIPYSGFLLKFVTCSDSCYKCTKMTGSLRDDLHTHVIGCYDFLCEKRARRENPGNYHRTSSLVMINNCGKAVSCRSRTAEARIRSSTRPCEI